LRHGRKALAPLKISGWTALAWLAAAAGRPLIGASIALGTAALLPRKLEPLGVPVKDSLEIALRGHAGAGRYLAGAPTRPRVPLGATEQHGPHLPFTVDTEIAVALCERLAGHRDVVIAPAVPYGSSGEHSGFPGTLSIGQEATELLLVELVRSAEAFAGVLLV